MSDSTPSKLSRSWLLFTTSLQIIRQNKRLMLFPILTSLFSLVMLLFFLSPALLYPSGHSWRELDHWKIVGSLFGSLRQAEATSQQMQLTGIAYAYIAIVYLVSMFFATFFNTAFYHEIMKALAGDPVSIRSGLAFAWSRVRSILMWSLLAGTVGLLIKAVEDRFGWIGRWVMRFVGMVWSVASVFAIPVLIREGGINPITMLRQSSMVLRKTWGESLVGYVGITVGSWIVLLAGLVFLIGSVALAVILKNPIILFASIFIWVCAMVLLSYLASLAGDVYRCALYVYASEGVVPAPYTPELMDAAWKIKKA